MVKYSIVSVNAGALILPPANSKRCPRASLFDEVPENPDYVLPPNSSLPASNSDQPIPSPR